MSFDDVDYERGDADYETSDLDVLPPPYHEVVGRQPSPPNHDAKSEEKETHSHSHAAPTPTSSDKHRRSRLVRVLRRLVCLPPTRPKSPPNSKPTSIWRQPQCGIQTGHCPRFWRPKYLLVYDFSPIQRLSGTEIDAAPWVAQLNLCSDDLSESHQKDMFCQWLKHLDRSWYDSISIHENPLDNKGGLLYSRRICLQYSPPSGCGPGWAARATIFHPETEWLADLPFSKVRELFRQQFLVSASAWVSPRCEPLEPHLKFYQICTKPVAEDYVGWVREEDCVDVDEPEASRLVQVHLESLVPGLRDYAEELDKF
ncbi:hypothetical protein N658DRAFT_496992 [Parathielavia hyrcaniae]|uniref:Uncharacterized protein n=1 Tax=Parathielavia hyrcaniae TaxID=113614 RepID=A0AAN6PZN8_9PEZI|nr:hypothetical protein N658DRAFT_496992 [Parathielavia hyrcaniae]